MQIISRIFKNQNYGLFGIAKISRTYYRQRHFKVVMVAHGASTWNEENKFCGWYDAPLSRRGKNEAVHAGRAIREAKFKFDVAFTSFLSRAQMSLSTILNETGQFQIPMVRSWRLNERHCGALTGLTMSTALKKYGEKEVMLWHGDYEAVPPPIKIGHRCYNCIIEDPRYLGFLSKEKFPTSESFKMAAHRAYVFWQEVIEPVVKKGQQTLIVGHRNSLRGIIKFLDRVKDEDAMRISIPTGIPFVYTLNSDLKPIKEVTFLRSKLNAEKRREKQMKK